MADAYLKVKDNGAQGLALVREETDTSVSELKTRISDIEDMEGSDITGLLNITRGKAWNGAVGRPATQYNANTRCSNNTPYVFPEGKYRCTVNTEYRMSYRTLDANNIVLSDSGWKTANFEFTANGTDAYAFTGGKLADAALTIDEFLDNVHIFKDPKIIEQINTNSADIETLETNTTALENTKINIADGLAVLTPPDNTPYVDITRDSSGTTITIYKSTSIWLNGRSGHRYNVPDNVVITLAAGSSTLQKVVFNTTTGAFSALEYYQAIPNNCILIMGIRTNYMAVSISCPYRVNGNMYNIRLVDEISERQNIVEYSNVKAINHRGFNTVAPENTIPAFKLSRNNGFHYVETDVRYTADNIPVLLHDTTINRTARNADGTTIAETVNISDITYEEALEYDFGIWKGTEYAGTKIPTLEEFVLFCKNAGLIPRIELSGGTEAQLNTMFGVIDKYGMRNKCEINLSTIADVEKILQKNPKAVIVFGMMSYNANTVDALGALKTVNNTFIINMLYGQITADLVEKCKTYDIELETWTVDSSSQIISINPYVTGVTSDNLIASTILYNNAMA